MTRPPPSPFELHHRVEEELLADDGGFAIVEEEVLGAPCPVFADRLPHLRAMLEASAGHGDRDYLVYGDRRIGFAEHHRLVASVAAALRERFGVSHGDRVAILAANRPEWVITWWAAVVLGAIPVALNGWWVADEILYALGDCEPAVLVGDRRRLERVAGESLPCPVIEIESDFPALEAHDPSASLPTDPIDEDHPACILYTSGTTGRPKGAVNTHRNVIALNRLQVWHGLRLFKLAVERPDATPRAATCTLVTSPLFHLSGLYTGAVALLANGVKCVFLEGRFDPVVAMQTIEREKVTSWGPMGTLAHRLMNHPDVAKYDLSSIHQIGSGGAPVSPELQAQMREVFPNARASMGLGYGMTEATGMATINFAEELEAHPTSVGRALPTMQVEIRDADGRPLPDGEEGEIHVHGPLVMREYWRRPDATAETILPGRWLRTGDVGRLEAGFLYVNSRARDLILRGAENVYPAEIELRLEAHPAVAEAAVVGVAHRELGQEVKAFVVPRDGERPTPEELARWTGESLAYYKVPAHWELRDDPLPRNATGKVLKTILLEGGDNPFEED
ncbi:MAG: class I adenylate-forming enzyme family protein [Thermoanaerobaculia bacterium]|nr:class I adenylate-forming enzyme family protein [Thermoanaerobaculia bacterium]